MGRRVWWAKPKREGIEKNLGWLRRDSKEKGAWLSSVASDLSSLGPMPTANVFAYMSALAQSPGCIIKVLGWMRGVRHLPSLHEYFWGSINWGKPSVPWGDRNVWSSCACGIPASQCFCFHPLPWFSLKQTPSTPRHAGRAYLCSPPWNGCMPDNGGVPAPQINSELSLFPRPQISEH